MQISHNLNGRMNKRLPIAIYVRLSRLPPLPTNEEERTYTDNVSPYGARVFSRCSWHCGEQAQVTAMKDESSICGEVVYCQRLDNARFCIGLKFQEQLVTWSTLSRYYFTVVSQRFAFQLP